jgi:hypothetical protein
LHAQNQVNTYGHFARLRPGIWLSMCKGESELGSILAYPCCCWPVVDLACHVQMRAIYATQAKAIPGHCACSCLISSVLLFWHQKIAPASACC